MRERPPSSQTHRLLVGVLELALLVGAIDQVILQQLQASALGPGLCFLVLSSLDLLASNRPACLAPLTLAAH